MNAFVPNPSDNEYDEFTLNTILPGLPATVDTAYDVINPFVYIIRIR